MTVTHDRPQESVQRHLDDAGVSFFVTDLEATILYANHTLEKKTGYALAELVGKTPGKLWGGNMDRAYYDRMWSEVRDHHRPFAGEVTNSRRRGGTFEDRIMVSPVCDAAGEIRYYLGLHSDAVGKKIEAGLEGRIRSALAGTAPAAGEFMNALGIASDDRTALHRALERDLVAPVRALFYRRDDDRTLLVAAQGDSEHFGGLYEKYYRSVCDYFYHRLSGDRAAAEDLAQETFVRAFSHLDRFRQANASYLTYLLRIAHNLLVNHYRDSRPAAALEDGDMGEEQGLDEHLDRAKLWDSLRLLGATERQIIAMKYQQGLSVKEIADLLHTSENAVKLHLSRGRKKLGGVLGGR